MLKKYISLSNLTLLTALSLSTVAAYYSIIGLTAIFAGAVIPIIVMGSILEVGKITTTVWLRKYWKRCGWLLKLYLVPAVVLLALLTSMGIFGFLSKAHMDQGVTAGDSQAKLALYDEKIKTQRDNIALARKALEQMDAQVDQRLSRSDSEQAAERAVAIRRQQANERTKLQKEIGEAQQVISKLNEERAPIAAENRKVEAEVGPIKYIAALIYGDNADQNMLEAAVRWVIILLVAVFDPLAIALVLAANASKEWDEEPEENDKPDSWVADVGDKPTQDEIKEFDDFVEQAAVETLKNIEPAKFNDPGEHPKDDLEYEEPVPEPVPEKSILEQHPYLLQPFVHFSATKPMVYSIEDYKKEEAELTVGSEPTADSTILAAGIDVVDRPGDYVSKPQEIITEGVTVEHAIRQLGDDGDYVLLDGKHMRKEAAKELRPDLFRITADNATSPKSNFGTKFPDVASKGDIFVRVDVLPNRVYKFDSKRWIEINKQHTDTYLHDREYLKHLVSMIENGQYDIELLSENEKAEIENYLGNQNS